MKFLADRTTGKLAKKLRALGFDVGYSGGASLEQAAEAALSEGRIFLTRSRRLSKRGTDLQVTVIEADHPAEQVKEVLEKLGLDPKAEEFFSRCLICNEKLQEVSKKKVEGRVPDFILQMYHEFHICPRCQRIYWPGTHLERMRKHVEETLAKTMRSGEGGSKE